MPRIVRVSIAIVVLALTFGAGRWAYGQAPQSPPPDPAARVISGNDVGFRVDRQETERLGRLTGTWVVRINGQWMEPAASLRSRPLGTR